MSRQQRADAWLVLVTLLWGTSYYLTDLCHKDLPPMCLNAFRFLTAFAVLGAAFRQHLRRFNRKTLRASLLVGLALSGTYILYGYGVSRTSLSNAAFICATAVLFLPLLNLVFDRKRPGQGTLLCVVLCVAGLGFLTLGDAQQPALGDFICLGVPVCYALDIWLIERAVRDPEVDPIALGVGQLGVVGIVTLCLSLLTEKPHLPTTPVTWAAALFLGLACTGAAFLIQTVEQQHTDAQHVGLIFTLEPVFATVVAVIFAGERLTAAKLLGMALMLGSLVLMELGRPIRRRKTCKNNGDTVQ